MPTFSHPAQPADLVHRLRRALSLVQLDCQCRTTLDGALDRLSSVEYRGQLRESLQHARRQRDWIASQLSYLADLDEITELESDQTVFEELALSFDEISAVAAEAAQSIREAQPTITAKE
jgi:hypothetical protein